MKLQVEIRAVLSEQDPSYRKISTMGIEKVIERFKKELSSQGVENLEVKITEVKNNEIQPA